MTSLRRRLFLILLAATGAIWLSAMAWISLGSRSELEHVLDARLQEAARMVHSLVRGGNIAAAAAPLPQPQAGYERQLSCQIWSLDGELVARSGGAPDAALAGPSEGFSERRVDGETWRVFTIVDAEKGVRVMVGDRIGLRDRLVRDLLAGLLAPALLITPLLGLLIWISLGRGLAPLHAVAREIAVRDGEDMRPIAPAQAPQEVRPLIGAINELFGKLEAARRHERDVTAFAAHELRTPLAGLKTQAQIALATDDAATRQAALRQMLAAVDRSTRLVRQLLVLAKLEARAQPLTAEPVNAGAMLRDIVAHTPASPGLTVTIAPELDALTVRVDRETLHLALRNLHENAAAHAAPGGAVRWTSPPGAIRVEDDGPGMPPDELPRATERFFRGRGQAAPGSGLGLTIAALAAERVGARLLLANRAPSPGLRAEIAWRA